MIVASPTEQTTAATDAVLALLVLASAVYLQKIGYQSAWKVRLWSAAFYLLSMAAVLGAIAHGIVLADELRAVLWYPLYLSLGMFIAFFVVASANDILGEAVAKRLLKPMLAMGAGFFIVTRIWSDSFFVFIVYETLALLFALVGYSWLLYNRRSEGLWQIVIGILLTIFAAVIQANKTILLQFVWVFDHNGVFHLVQMGGIIFLVLGLRITLLKRPLLERSLLERASED